MFGLLNIDKPAGITSRTVVNRVQYLVRPDKTGHAGTLDPLATGVLVVAVGPATRLIPYVQATRKTYLATFLLDHQSETLDTEANVQPVADPLQPAQTEIAAALPHFVGRLAQVPPAHSAIKVKGRPAYQLARAGRELQLAPRWITIDRIDLIEYDYPRLQLDITCSSGTYVRSLGRDLAQHLGTQAVMTALQRTAIGDFRVATACSWGSLADQSLTAHTLATWLLPPQVAVDHLPRVQLDADQIQRLRNGQAITKSDAASDGEHAGFDYRGDLVAILTPRDDALWQPIRVFPADS